jgi:hypothetical protein
MAYRIIPRDDIPEEINAHHANPRQARRTGVLMSIRNGAASLS